MSEKATRYLRKIIAVEKKLGFLYVPAEAAEFLPEGKKLNIYLEGESTAKELSYNPEHRRIFGLTEWYNKMDIQAESILDVNISEEKIQIHLSKEMDLVEDEETETDEKKVIDISGLSSVAKGNIVEDRIKELILLYGQGLLNVYRPVIDNDGVDLIVLKSGSFSPIFIQVKSRYNVKENGQLILTLSGNTFTPHHSFFLLGASFNPKTLELDDRILFIPSEKVNEMAVKLKHKNKLRVVAFLNEESKSQWSPYMINKKDLVGILIEKFEEMAKYYK